MFTFIKIAYHGAFHGRNMERPGHKSHPRALIPEGNDGHDRTNPWERELKRLSNQKPAGDRRRYFRGQLPQPRPVRQSPSMKHSTLQDLQHWWGQSCAPSKPDQQLESRYFAPPPGQRRNHWFQ